MTALYRGVLRPCKIFHQAGGVLRREIAAEKENPLKFEPMAEKAVGNLPVKFTGFFLQ